MVKEMRLRYGKMISNREQLEKLHVITLRETSARIPNWSSPGQPFDLHYVTGPLVYDIMGQVMFDRPWLATEVGQKVYKAHKFLIMVNNSKYIYLYLRCCCCTFF